MAYDGFDLEHDSYLYSYDYVDPYFENDSNMTSIITHSVLLYIGLCTNIWMLWSLYKTWEKGSRAHFYLLALCIADILALCIRCSLEIGVKATFTWKGGEYGCKIFMAFHMFGAMLAHFILAGFNVDNMVTAVSKRPIKTVRIVSLVLSVVFSLLFCTPQVIFYNAVHVGFRQQSTWCLLSYDDTISAVYPFVFLATIFCIPLLLMLFCAAPALCLWCGSKDNIAYDKMKHEEGNGGMKNIGKDIGMVLTYDILFMLCWTPLTVLGLFPSSYHRWPTLYLVSDFLTLANSCLNPIIYGIFTCVYKRLGKTSPEL